MSTVQIELQMLGPMTLRCEGQEVRATDNRARKIWLLLAALGPGIVTAMAGNDAGGISTYSTVGAKFGFATLWVIPIM